MSIDNVTTIHGQAMTVEAMQAMMADMQRQMAEQAAKIERMKAAGQRKLTLKVTEKGGLSLYGMGRFPVTLYRGQWERLLDASVEIREFILDNADKLSVKD